MKWHLAPRHLKPILWISIAWTKWYSCGVKSPQAKSLDQFWITLIWGYGSFLHVDWQLLYCLGAFVENQWTLHVDFFWIFYYVPLIFVFIPILLHCSFIMSLKIKWCKYSDFVYFSKIVLIFPGLFNFHMNFRTSLSISDPPKLTTNLPKQASPFWLSFNWFFSSLWAVIFDCMINNGFFTINITVQS